MENLTLRFKVLDFHLHFTILSFSLVVLKEPLVILISDDIVFREIIFEISSVDFGPIRYTNREKNTHLSFVIFLTLSTFLTIYIQPVFVHSRVVTFPGGAGVHATVFHPQPGDVQVGDHRVV